MYFLVPKNSRFENLDRHLSKALMMQPRLKMSDGIRPEIAVSGRRGFLFRLPERQGRPHIEKDVGMNYFVIYYQFNIGLLFVGLYYLYMQL